MTLKILLGAAACVWRGQHPASVVAMTVTGVCVSFSHYVDGMIPIRSDRGSHCKHSLLETEVREIVCDKVEGSKRGKQTEVREVRKKNKIKRQRSVTGCVYACVYTDSRRFSLEQLSAQASVSWLQTSLLDPRLNDPVLPWSLCLTHHSPHPYLFSFPHLLSPICFRLEEFICSSLCAFRTGAEVAHAALKCKCIIS